MKRTPDGDVYEESELESGEQCSRCGDFVPIRSDLPPKPENPDWWDLQLKGYAGTDNHVLEDKKAVLCEHCREEFSAFMGGGTLRPPRGPIRDWVEDHQHRFVVPSDNPDVDVEDVVDEIVEAIADAGGDN